MRCATSCLPGCSSKTVHKIFYSPHERQPHLALTSKLMKISHVDLKLRIGALSLFASLPHGNPTKTFHTPFGVGAVTGIPYLRRPPVGSGICFPSMPSWTSLFDYSLHSVSSEEVLVCYKCNSITFFQMCQIEFFAVLDSFNPHA